MIKNIEDKNYERIQKEKEKKLAAKKREQESQIKKMEEQKKQEVLSAYKRLVVDSFQKTFTENYGDMYDKKSLTNSLKFDIKITKNGLCPNFSFDKNTVKFRSDFKKENRKFNENQWNNFIGTSTIIDTSEINESDFDTFEEYDVYQDAYVDYDEIKKIDGAFIPVSNSERFGTFNRINKLMGYSSKNNSEKQAEKQINSDWNSIYKKMIKNL